MSKRRLTFEVLRGGQLRPYADTVHHYRLIYEWQGMEGFKDKDATFVRQNVTREDIARRDAKHLGSWTEKGEGDWASTRLDWLKMIEPGLWEWHTTSAYTD